MADDVPVGRPDLILVMTDQQRYDQVGYASAGHFETPNLDALAGKGVIFDAAYSASTICVPARMALLTGLQPHRLPTQVNGLALREGFWTVAHELRHAGYETALFGKMHFAPTHAEHGFDTMRLCEHAAGRLRGPLSDGPAGQMDDYHDWLVDNGLTDRRVDEGAPSVRVPADAHPTAWVEREVSTFLATRDRDRPLFLVISFPHPHAPYDPPEPYASMYAPTDSVLPATGYEANEGLPLSFQVVTSQSRTRAAALDEHRVRRFLATVRGLVKQIDDALGRLLPRFDLGSSLVFFTSDHGDFGGNRGLMRKNPWLPFDDLARVPFMVAGLGIPGGRRVPQLVQSCDLALTCLDYAGISPPAGAEFDTRSLRPILEGTPGPADLERSVYSATSVGWPMIRTGRYKYIEPIDRKARVVFDLEADPLETVNLGRDPALDTIRQDLRDRLRALLQQPVLDIPAPVGDRT